MDKKLKPILTIIFTVFLCIVIMPLSFGFFILLVLSNYPILFIALPILFAVIIFMLIWWNTNKSYRITFFTLLASFTILLFSCGGFFIYKLLYLPSITVHEKPNGNVYDFLPFEKNSLVAKLEEESSLQLKENIPVIDGATALFPIYSAFARACFPEAVCELNEENSSLKYTNTVGAYEELIDGTRDIIFCAGPSIKQIEAACEKGLTLHCTPIGKEAFVFFVNAKNPIDSLRASDIRKIYSGEITNWKELGGADEKIKAFQRAENSGSQTALERFMGTVPLQKAPSEEVSNFMGGIVERVQDYRNNRGAIGYSFRYFVNEMQEAKHIKLLKIDGVAPTVETIKNGTYPLANYFYAVTTENSKNVLPFLDWILSPQGQYLIEKTGYVGL